MSQYSSFNSQAESLYIKSVAVYLRKSRGDNAEESTEETLARHKQILLEFAQKNNLIIASEDFYEEVVSGDSIVARPKMIALLEAVDQGKYDAVLCMDIDRLGRGGLRDQGLILETFKNSDTLIITLEKTYDLNDELDEELTEFKTFFSRREYKMITKRLRRGLMRTINDGAYVANAPFGYKKTVIDKIPSLEIIPEEAKYVKMMFDMYVNQQIGTHTIAETLNAMGVKPKRGANFSRSTARGILQNPVYAGKVSWNKVTYKKSPTTGRVVTAANNYKNWTIIDGKHEPIIDWETYQAAQAFRKRHALPSYNTGELKNPLAGLIVCKKCGKRLQMQVCQKKYPYLRCTTQGCSGSANIKDVESAILEILQNKWSELIVPAKKPDTSILDGMLQDAKKEQADLMVQRDKLLTFLEKGVYDLDLFAERMEKLKLNITANKAVIENLETKKQSLEAADYAILAAKVQSVLDHYQGSDIAKKNALLQSVIKKVIYEREYGGMSPFSITVHLTDK